MQLQRTVWRFQNMFHMEEAFFNVIWNVSKHQVCIVYNISFAIITNISSQSDVTSDYIDQGETAGHC